MDVKNEIFLFIELVFILCILEYMVYVLYLLKWIEMFINLFLLMFNFFKFLF